MKEEIVSENCCHAVELLDAFVCGLVLFANTTTNIENFRVLIMNKTLWNLGVSRIITNVAIVCLHSLPYFKHMLEEESKNVDIRPIATS